MPGPTTNTLTARPEPYAFEPLSTALIVVDMQNAYCSPGGYFDKVGFDIGDAPAVIDAVGVLVRACRSVSVPVVWLQNGWDRELVEAGGPLSVNQRKGNALKLMHEKPELKGELLTKGGWDYAFVDALSPVDGEYVVAKPRYSGFASTNLDIHLRGLGIRTLLVCGVATNVCVESTIRDAFFLEYHPILIRDACAQAGPRNLQDATVFNVERFFGWTCTVLDICNIMPLAELTKAAK
jgi:ureidoacrylate peracid hydrolase